MPPELLWIVLAYAAGLAAKALRLPSLVGFLTAGLVLALIGESPTTLLKQIGDLGVMFLLFTVGLHLRWQNLVRAEVLGVGGLHLLVSAVVFAAFGLMMGLDAATAVLLAVALGFSSTVLTAKSLESRNELGAYHGRVAIGILIFQDVVAIILLALTGKETPSLWAFLLLLLPLTRPFLLRLLNWSGRDELMVLFGLLLALVVGALFQAVGLSDKLGALVAGLLLVGHPRADDLDQKLWSFKEVFLVAFFLQVGMAGFPDLSGLLMVLFLLLLLPLKGLLFFFLLVRFNLRARTAFMTAVALTAYSEFALIVATAAAEGGLLGEETVVMLALLTAVSYALNAPISRSANTLWERVEPSLIRFERPGDHPTHDPTTFGSAHYLVVGMGRAGTAAYEALIAAGERPLGLDVDPDRIANHLRNGRRVIFGDAQEPELWRDIDLTGIRGVMLALPNMRGKIRSTAELRRQGFTGPISALIREEEDKEELLAAGVTAVSLPITEAGRELAAVSLQQTAGQNST